MDEGKFASTTGICNQVTTESEFSDTTQSHSQSQVHDHEVTTSHNNAQEPRLTSQRRKAPCQHDDDQ